MYQVGPPQSNRAVANETSPYLQVWAPSRLHWGLLNESGTGGRVDGGVGVGIMSPAWSFRMGWELPSPPFSELDQVAAAVISRLSTVWGTPPCSITFESVIPLHVGLGAKTSLSLAVGRGYATLCGLRFRSLDLAGALGRGGTSGVGVHVSDGGGLVVEYGHRFPADKKRFGPSSSRLAVGVPQLARRLQWPLTWKFLLIRPAGVGLSGVEEEAFFQSCCPVPEWETRTILRLVSEQLVPSVGSRFLGGVQAYLGAIQGLGLKVREWRTQGDLSRDLSREWARARSKEPLLSPLCLSSLGPQLFMVTDDSAREMTWLRRIGLPAESVRIAQCAPTGVLVQSAPEPAKSENIRTWGL